MDTKKKYRLIAVGAIVIAVIAVLAIALSGGTNAEREVLQNYYEGMYSVSDSDMILSLLPDRQAAFYEEVTVGGTNFAQFTAWKAEAVQLVGENVRVDVEIIRTGEEDAAELTALRRRYPDAERVHKTAFSMTLTGDKETVQFVGVMPMARIKGDWFMMQTDAYFRRVTDGGQTAED